MSTTLDQFNRLLNIRSFNRPNTIVVNPLLKEAYRYTVPLAAPPIGGEKAVHISLEMLNAIYRTLSIPKTLKLRTIMGRKIIYLEEYPIEDTICSRSPY